MVNQSKKKDPRFWKKWEDSGAVAHGKAYALVYLGASKEDIKAELPRARQAARTPPQLEISIREVKDLMTDKKIA